MRVPVEVGLKVLLSPETILKQVQQMVQNKFTTKA